MKKMLQYIAVATAIVCLAGMTAQAAGNGKGGKGSGKGTCTSSTTGSRQNLRLRDGSCLTAKSASGATASRDRLRDRLQTCDPDCLQLRDGSCLLDE